MPSLFSRNDDDPGMAFHISHKQNATKKIAYIILDYLEVMVFFSGKQTNQAQYWT